MALEDQMARKTATTPAPQEIETIPQGMDYAQHQATWNAVTALVKWSIVALLIIVVALYCFIEGGQPVLGTLLLLLLPIGAVVLAVSRYRSAA
jgi:hypothetical protein